LHTYKQDIGPRFERHRLRLEDNIKIKLKEIDCEDVDYVQLTLDWFQWQIPFIILMNTQVSYETRNFLTD
jgi:hypothetical protein